jgi:hypothetical protein
MQSEIKQRRFFFPIQEMVFIKGDSTVASLMNRGFPLLSPSVSSPPPSGAPNLGIGTSNLMFESACPRLGILGKVSLWVCMVNVVLKPR